MLCRLRHPNILDFYGACLTADTVCFANGRSMQGLVWQSLLLLCTLLTECVPRLTQMMVISQVRNLSVHLAFVTSLHQVYKWDVKCICSLPARVVFQEPPGNLLA